MVMFQAQKNGREEGRGVCLDPEGKGKGRRRGGGVGVETDPVRSAALVPLIL